MKPLAILGLIGILGSVVLGVLNRSKFIDTRKQKDDYNRQILSNFDKTDEKNKLAADEIGKYQDEKKKFESDKYAKETEEKTKAAKETEDKEILAEAEKVQREIDAINGQIAEKLKDFGGKPEELQAKRDALRAEIEAQAEKLAVLEKEIEVTNSLVADNGKTIGRFTEAQQQRTKSIALSQREGIINAVNPDWAFCIVNMGKSDGVSTDSRLLVKRGQQLIGKLNITQIESNQTVAEIDLKSVKGGNGVQPGDQVIFDNQN
jgi:hypothetical protein